MLCERLNVGLILTRMKHRGDAEGVENKEKSA